MMNEKGVLKKEDYSILLVDDEADYLKKIKSLLEIKGYKIHVSQSGQEDVIAAFRGQLASFDSEQDVEISIEGILKRAQIILQKDAKLNYCKINQDIQVDPATKIKDGNKLITVINNLLRNSIQAYDENGGEIDVKVTQDGENINITVKDNGCGIPKEVQDKIFKEVVTTKGENGMGLGLYVAYAMVKGKLGGSMWVESEEGKGTEVCVVVPVMA